MTKKALGFLLSIALLGPFQVSLFAQGGAAHSGDGAHGISIIEFGGKGDGVADNTPALNAALEAAMPRSLTIEFPCGRYRFTSPPKAIETGVRLRGCGSVGSTPGYGSALIADYNESSAEQGFLTWNGAFKGGNGCCAGTGGGIDQLVVFKGPGKKGGTAIKFTGIDDGHRAGYSTVSNVLITSVGGGTWDHNLIIDGSCCTSSGGQGVRDIYLNNFWAAQAIAPQESILLRNAIQVFWHGGEVMPAGAGSNCGVTITGGKELTQQSTNVLISDVYIAGSLAVLNAHSVSFRGLIGGDAIVEPTAASVLVAGLVGGKITSRSTTTTIEANKLISLPPGGQVITRSLRTGTGASADLAGSCTAAQNSCSYAFSGSYTAHPICVASDETTANGTVRISYTGATAVTFTTPGPRDVVDFICVARN